MPCINLITTDRPKSPITLNSVPFSKLNLDLKILITSSNESKVVKSRKTQSLELVDKCEIKALFLYYWLCVLGQIS